VYVGVTSDTEGLVTSGASSDYATSSTAAQTSINVGVVYDSDGDGALSDEISFTDDADNDAASADGDGDSVSYTENADGTVTVTVSGADSDFEAGDILTVNSGSYFSETVELTETGMDTGEFTGTITVQTTDSAGKLHVSNGDSVTLHFFDASANNQISTSSTTVDTQSPSANIDSPTSSSPVYRQSSETVTVTYDASDADSSVSDVTVQIVKDDGTPVLEETGQAAGTDKQTSFDLSSLTEATYDVRVIVTDSAGNTKTTRQTDALVVDDTSPSISKATTGDSDGDGKIDQVTVTFSEPVTNVEASDYSVSGYSNVQVASSGSDGDNTVVFSFDEASSTDTGATPTVSYTEDDDGNADETTDLAGNLLSNGATTSVAAADGAAPVATGFTATVNSNDKVDVTVQLSETIDSTDGDAALSVDVTKPDETVDTLSLESGFSGSSDSFTGTVTTKWKGTYTAEITALADNVGNAGSTGATTSTVYGNARSASIVASPDGPDQTATHTVKVTLDSNTDVQTYEIVYQGADVSNVGTENILALGVDGNGDGDLQDAEDRNFLNSSSNAGGLNQVSVSSDGTVLTFDTSSSTTISAGSQLLIKYNDTVNPAGDENVQIRLDPSTPDVDVTRTLTIGGTVPSVNDVSVGGTSLGTDASLGTGATGQNVGVAVTFSESMASAGDVTLTVDGTQVALNNASFDGTTLTADADITVNGEVDAKISVADATDADDGNVIDPNPETRTFTIDTEPLGLVNATTQEDTNSATSDKIVVVLNDSVDDSSLDAKDFQIADTDAADVDTGDTDNDDTVVLTTNSELSSSATPSVSVKDGAVLDDGGNGAVAESVTAQDGIAPTLSSLSLTNPAGDTLNVSFDSSESLANIQVNITNSSGDVVATLTESDFTASSGTYTASTTVPDGTYDATVVTAKDAAGNDRSGSVTPTATTQVDTSGPTFELTSPSEDLVKSISDDQIVVETSDDTGVDAETVYVSVTDSNGTVIDRTRAAATGTDAVSLDGNNNNVLIDTSSLDIADGSVTVNVEAADTIGNSNSTSLSFELDSSEASGFSVVEPSATQNLTSDSTLDVSWQYNETNPQDVVVKLVGDSGATYTYDINETSYVDDGATKSVTLDLDAFTDFSADGDDEGLDDSSYTVEVHVTDSAENNVMASASSQVTVDDDAPSIMNLQPGHATSAQQNITVDITDATSGVDTSTIDVEIWTANPDNDDDAEAVFTGSAGDQGVTYADGKLTVNPAEAGFSLADGDYYIVVSAEDYSANDNSKSFWMDANVQKPKLESAHAVVGQDTITLHFSEEVMASDEALSADDFAYQDGNNAGAGSIVGVSVDGSDVILTLDDPVTAADLGTDYVNVQEGAVTDTDTPTRVVSVDAVTLMDAHDPVVDVTANNVSSSNVGNYTVDVSTNEPVDVTVTVSDGTNSMQTQATLSSAGSHMVTLGDLSNLADGDLTVSVTATDAGSNTGTASAPPHKDTVEPSIVSAEADAGTTHLYVTFDEPVADATASDLALTHEGTSLSISEVHPVGSHNDDNTVIHVVLTEPLPAAAFDTTSANLSAGGVTDINGNANDSTAVAVTDRSTPELIGVDATNGSATVTLAFSETVTANDGSVPSAANLTYTDNNGGSATAIESVEYGDDTTELVVTLNDTVNATDLGNDMIGVAANNLTDAAGNAVPAASMSVSDNMPPEITNVEVTSNGSTVTMNVTASEELSALDAAIGSWWKLSTEDSAPVTELTIDDFEVTQTDSGFVYTATYETSRDGRYGGSVGTVTDIAGNSADGWEFDSTAVDSSAPMIVDSEIVGEVAAEDTTFVRVEFSEPIDASSIDARDVSIEGGEVVGIADGSGEDGSITVITANTLETGDSPNVSVAGDSYTELYGDETTGTDDVTVVNTAELDLQAGANLVSVPAASGSLSVSEIDTSNVDVIWTYDDGTWQSYDPDASQNDFTSLEGGQGYIFVMSQADEIDVNVHNTIGDSRSIPNQQQLEEGWNLVGHYQETQQPAWKAFSSAESVFRVLEQSGGNYTYSDVSGWDEVKPGEAYWVFVQDDEVYTEAPIHMEGPIQLAS
jgi:hypothetical protein